jgi:RHS repeat-associated protein
MTVMRNPLPAAALLLFALFAPQCSEASQYIQNGDFGNGLTSYTTTVVSTGSFSGFPHFVINTSSHCIPSAQVGNPFLSLDVPGGADGYVEQQVVLPNGPTTLSFTSWVNQDAVTVTISIITVSDGKEHVLETYTPPSLEVSASACTGNTPITKSYSLTAYAGQTIKVRLRATSGGVNGTIADFDNLSISDTVVPPSITGSVLYGPSNPATTLVTPACGEFAADPVNCGSGNLTETVGDLVVPGRGRALNLARTYNSLDAASGGSGMFGRGWSSSYGEFLSIAKDGSVTVHQAGGATVTFSATKTGYAAPSYVTATLVQNKDMSYTFTLKNRLSDIFDKTGRLIGQTDRNGYKTSLSYDSHGHLSKITDPAKRAFVFTTGANGLVTRVSDPAKHTVQYGYDSAGNLASVTDVGGGETLYFYGQNHLLTAVVDPLGGQVDNRYDGSNRVVSQMDQLGNITGFSYGKDASGDLSTRVTDPDGNVSLHTFSKGLLISLTTGYGTSGQATTTYLYDADSDIIKTTDANGKVWGAGFDAPGNQTVKVDPLGHTTTTVYNKINDPTSVTDPSGVTTTFTYDSKGNLASSSRPLKGTSLSAVTTYVHGGSAGDVTAIVGPTGAQTKFTYDKYGNTTSVTDPDGGKTTRTFDITGRVLTSVSPPGNLPKAKAAAFTTQYAYDAFGDITSVTDPLGHTTSRLYDLKRELIAVTDPDNRITLYEYDATGRTTKTTRSNGTVVLRSYDPAGNLLSRTDALGHATTFSYDSQNRRISSTDPLGRQTTFAYDPVGNTISRTEPGGLMTTMTYNAAGMLTGVSYSDGLTPSVSYAYDALNRRVSMSDGSGKSTWQYDSLGRVTQKVNGAGQKVSYVYDLRGLLTGMTYPNGKAVSRKYDQAARLTSVSDWLGHTTALQWDASGYLAQIIYPNGWTGQYQRDNASRLTGINYFQGSGQTDTRKKTRKTAPLGPRLSFAYIRTNAGLLAMESINTSTPVTYSYDQFARLSGISGLKYGYDDGDRVVSIPGRSALSYDDADQLVTGLGAVFSFDSRGNRTAAAPQSGNTITYTYDQANRLTGIEGLATYVYNGDGLRVTKTVGTRTQNYTWAGNNLIADGSVSYIYGPDSTPIEQISASGTPCYYHADQLGSVRMLTDSTGAIQASYAFDPYGNTSSGTGQVTIPFGYAGAYTDGESSLIYLRARYYDPKTAQFLTKDPGFASTGQAYAYAADNPVNLTDPSGAGPFAWVWNGAKWVWGQVTSVFSPGTVVGPPDTSAQAVVGTACTSNAPTGTNEGAGVVYIGVTLSASNIAGNQVMTTLLMYNNGGTPAEQGVANQLMTAWGTQFPSGGANVAQALQFVQQHQAEFNQLQSQRGPGPTSYNDSNQNSSGDDTLVGYQDTSGDLTW